MSSIKLRYYSLIVFCFIFCFFYSGVGNAQECGTTSTMKAYLKKHPAYARIIEYQETKMATHIQNLSRGRVEEQLYQIPIVVHVLENGSSLISDSQIKSAIANLNDAFRGRGKFSNSPDTKIEFILAQKTPTCQSTTGIIRVDGRQVSGYADYGMKKRTQGGDEKDLKALSKWSNLDYYNIWIVDKIDGVRNQIAGFAYYPGASGRVDGIVILANLFSQSEETLIHEMGHGLNLHHTFEGDNSGTQCPPTTNGCGFGNGDCVDDTQAHQRSASGSCLSGFNNCTSQFYDENLRVNHMNYYCSSTRFTEGQKQRMRAAIETTNRHHLTISEGKNPPQTRTQACIPTRQSLNHSYGIRAINLNGMSINSSSSGADNTHYIDHTCMRTTQLQVLEKYNISIQGASSQNHIFNAWADWNNDGDFEDIGETIFKNKVGINMTEGFTVPVHAKLNQKLRFRVSTDEAVSDVKLLACQSVNKGQIEDFAVNISHSSITKPEIEVYDQSTYLPHNQAKVNFNQANTGSFSEKTLRVYNFGNQNLVFNNPSVQITGSNDFSVVQALPNSISGNSFTDFKIRFTPSSDGVKNAVLTIQSNDSDESSYSIQLESKATKPIIQVSSSTGVIAENSIAKDFGKQNLSDKITYEIKLKNIGDGQLEFSDNQKYTLSDSDNFQVLNFTKKSLEVGEEMTCLVQFSPLTETNHSTTLSIFSNSPNSPYKILFSGQGVLPNFELFKDNQKINNQDTHLVFSGTEVGNSMTVTFEIKNTGEGYLKVPNQQITSNNTTVVEVVDMPNEITPSQDNASFNLKISPQEIEADIIKMTIPNNDPEENPFIFFMTVSGISSKIESKYDGIVLNPKADIVDFGTVILGQKSNKKYIEIKNIGNKKLNISNISVSGSHASDFDVTLTSTALNPYESGVIEVIFEPTAKNIREATIILENNSAFHTAYPLKIRGRGIPIEPDIEVVGVPHGTGSATFSGAIYSSTSRTFTLKNTGILPLNFSTVFQIQGQNANEFEVIRPPNVAVLAPQASTTFEVLFTRSSNNEKIAQILISNDDPDENPYSFTLRSDRIPPPPPTVEEWLSLPFPEITASSENDDLQLVWWGTYPIAGIQFEILRSIPNQAEPELIATIQGTFFQDNLFTDDMSELAPNTYYTYSIRAIFDDLSSEIQTIQILTPPALPQLQYNRKVCEGNSSFLRVEASEGTKYFRWYESDSSGVPLTNDLGEAITSSVFNTPILQTSKTYYVAPVGLQFESSERLAILAEVEPKPVAKILADSLVQICDNESFVLNSDTIQDANHTWYWNGIRLGKNASKIEVKRRGNYVLEINTESCQVFSDTVILEVLETPEIEFEQPQSVTFCGDGEVSVQEFPDIEYEWFDSNRNFIKKGNKLQVFESDTFTIKAIHPNGCAVEDHVAVTVHPYPPTPKISVNNPICEGETVQFSVESIPNATYSWSGFLLGSTKQNPTLEYSSQLKNGTYHLTVEVNGCHAFASVDLVMGSIMDYSIDKQDISCYGVEDGQIEVTSHNESLLMYRLGEFGQTQFGKGATFDSLTFGNHTLIIETEEGCEETHELFIDQPADFSVSVMDDKKITSRWSPVQFDAFGAQRYRWFPADGLDNDTIPNPIANPSQTTTYTVIGYDEQDCERYAEVTVEVLDEDEILPHLVVSPNGDGLNDVWKIKNIEYFPNLSIEIHTRMGLKIFEQTQYQNDWDGTLHDGTWLPAGTYYYKIFLPEENRILGIGDINLIR